MMQVLFYYIPLQKPFFRFFQFLSAITDALSTICVKVAVDWDA